MLTASKLRRLAEAGAFSRILAEVRRCGVATGGVGPGGLEVAALGVALGRACEVSYEVTADVEALLGGLERAWEERAGAVSGSTAGLVARGLMALEELCGRVGREGVGGEIALRGARLLREAGAGGGVGARAA